MHRIEIEDIQTEGGKLMLPVTDWKRSEKLPTELASDNGSYVTSLLIL
jgi:hypothetical protein